jgi:hypothetical protein
MAGKETTVELKDGRTLTLAKIRGAKRMALLRLLGADNVRNFAYSGIATMVVAVKAIDGTPQAFPQNVTQLEALVEQFDDDNDTIGTISEAYDAAFSSVGEDEKEATKN